MPRVVFIAHPMSGDIEGNMQKVVAICRAIHSIETVPVFPSALTRRYLDAHPASQDRQLAAVNIEQYFARGFVDELWLYGEEVTAGMWHEVGLARRHNIRVVGMSPETRAALKQGEAK